MYRLFPSPLYTTASGHFSANSASPPNAPLLPPPPASPSLYPPSLTSDSTSPFPSPSPPTFSALPASLPASKPSHTSPSVSNSPLSPAIIAQPPDPQSKLPSGTSKPSPFLSSAVDSPADRDLG